MAGREGEEPPGGRGDDGDLLSTIVADLKAMNGSLETLTQTVNGLEAKIVTNIRTIIKQETRKFNDELELLKGRMDNLEARINNSQVGTPTSDFDIDRSVIILNLEKQAQEDVAAKCEELFADVLGVQATVTRALRTKERNPEKPALVKCELASRDEKIAVLRKKTASKGT